jgi:hypothetical protein
MPVTVDTTIAGVNATSYVTVAEVSQLLAAELYGTAWEDVDEQAAAVVTATRVLDAQIADKVSGWPTTSTQALLFPRQGLRTRNGAVVDSMSIPVDLKRAVALLALRLARLGRMPTDPADAAGIEAFTLGPMEFQFDKAYQTQREDVLGDDIWAILSWLLDSPVASRHGMIAISRV